MASIRARSQLSFLIGPVLLCGVADGFPSIGMKAFDDEHGNGLISSHRKGDQRSVTEVPGFFWDRSSYDIDEGSDGNRNQLMSMVQDHNADVWSPCC